MIMLYKEKKYLECEKLLSDVVKSNSQSTSMVKLYLIQILLLQSKFTEAIEVFKSLDEYKTYKLGIVRNESFFF
jgi:hypothetical protein